MKTLHYILIAVLILGGCGSVFGKDEETSLTPEQVRDVLRRAEQGNYSAYKLIIPSRLRK